MWLELGRQGCGNQRKSLALFALCCIRLDFFILVNDGALLCLFFFAILNILNRGEMSLWCYLNNLGYVPGS